MTNKAEESKGRTSSRRTSRGKFVAELFSSSAEPYGFSFPEWTAMWWKWLVSIPREFNPAADVDGKNSEQNQNRENVWFLAGTVKPLSSAKRRCQIPAGKAILFPILATEISYLEDSSIKTDSQLITSAAWDISHAIRLEAHIDRIRLENVETYRVCSGLFDLTYPNDNIFGASRGTSRAASDGFWIFLKPLPKGIHWIYFRGVEPNFQTEVWYTLNVR